VLPTSAMVKYIILQKSVQWEPSRSVWTNGRTHRSTDMMKLIIAFCNSVNMPKKMNASVSICIFLLQVSTQIWR